MEQRNDLNRKLASLLGWTHFEAAGGALLGSPPWWAGNSRGQAQVPDWEADWRHAGVLMSTHHCVLMLSRDAKIGDAVEAFTPASNVRVAVAVAKYRSIDDAYRAAIIHAVIQKLEPRGFSK